VVQPNGTSWHKLEYVEQEEQGEAGLQIYVEQVEQEQGGLQIDVEQVEQGQVVCPAEPLHLCQSGSTRPWTMSSLIFHGARCNAAAGSRINFRTTFIPKLLLRLLWFFRRTAALFRQIRTFPQFFVLNPFWEILESGHIQQIVRYSMLAERTNLDKSVW